MKRTEIWRGAVLAAAVLATGGLLATNHTEGAERGSGRGLPAATNAKWAAECGACHLAYPPGFLPERSWQAVMAGLERHFGENAALDPPTRAEIARFLAGNAADRNGSRRSATIAASIAPGSVPLRITATRWFDAKHDEIGATVWQRDTVASRANCGACHRTADRGDYSERDVAIPRADARVQSARAAVAK